MSCSPITLRSRETYVLTERPAPSGANPSGHRQSMSRGTETAWFGWDNEARQQSTLLRPADCDDDVVVPASFD